MTVTPSEWTIGRVEKSANTLPNGFTFHQLSRSTPEVGTASLRRSMQILCARGVYTKEKDGALIIYYRR